VEKERAPLRALFRSWTIIFPSIGIGSRGIDLDVEKEQALSGYFCEPGRYFTLNWPMFPGNRCRSGEGASRLQETFQGKTIIFPSISACSWRIDLGVEKSERLNITFQRLDDHFPLN
jgi:hypothetical protein